MPGSYSRPKRSYTEKDIINKLDGLEKRIRDLTDAVRRLSDQVEEKQPAKREYAYGIKGLADVLGCSVATANRIKATGDLNGAIIQRNRRIIVDVQKVLELFDDPFSKWGTRKKSKLK